MLPIAGTKDLGFKLVSGDTGNNKGKNNMTYKLIAKKQAGNTWKITDKGDLGSISTSALMPLLLNLDNTVTIEYDQKTYLYSYEDNDDLESIASDFSGDNVTCKYINNGFEFTRN